MDRERALFLLPYIYIYIYAQEQLWNLLLLGLKLEV